MEDYQNVFEIGVLIVFETHNWQASKKVPEDVLKVLLKDENTEWIRSTKQLMDKSALLELNSLITKFRNTIDEVVLPFPIESMRFVAKDEVDSLSVKLNNIREEIEDKAIELENKYEDLKEKAKAKLKPRGLWNPKDYPRDIKKRFGVQFRFAEMSVPGEMKKFSPKIYKEEVEKYRMLMKQTRDEAVIFLREAFLDIISHITERLTGTTNGEPNIIRQDTLDKLDTFFQEFRTKNVFKDEELNKIIGQARDTMLGVNAKDLRTSDALREAISKNMEKIEDTLDKSITKFRRTIMVD